MSGAADAVDTVAAALAAADVVVHELTSTAAPVGPCAVVRPPVLREQVGAGQCVVFDWQVPVTLLAGSTAAQSELVALVDVAVDALAAYGCTVLEAQPVGWELSPDATAAAYDLLVTV